MRRLFFGVIFTVGFIFFASSSLTDTQAAKIDVVIQCPDGSKPLPEKLPRKVYKFRCEKQPINIPDCPMGALYCHYSPCPYYDPFCDVVENRT